MRTIRQTKYDGALVSWVLFVAIAAIYLAFPTKNYYWDGISFAQAIEDAPALSPTLFHPNHLFYEVLGYIFYRLIRSVGIDLRAVQALQIMNGLLGALAAFVLFHILRRALRSSYLSVTLTILFAFSATWWRFATDADAYIVSVLFLLISFYLILPSRNPHPLLVAVTFSASMCFHELSIFFYPVVIVGLFLQPSPLKRGPILNPIYFSVSAFAITVITYFYSFYLVTGTLNFRTFIRWITNFTHSDGFKFNAWSNFIFALRGSLRLFFGGRFNLIDGLINPFIVVLIISLGALIFTLALNLIRNFKKPNFQCLRSFRQVPQGRSLALLCAVWIGVYLIFLFFWLPHHTFYRLFYLSALILLIGLVMTSDKTTDYSPGKFRLALLVAIMAIANFLFLIFPYSHTQKYPPLSFALEMNQVWPPGTVVYYGMRNSDNRLVRYFNPSTIWEPLVSTKVEPVESELCGIYSKGAAAWLETSAIDQLLATPEGAQWLSSHAEEKTRRELISPIFRIRFVQVVPRDCDGSYSVFHSRANE